MRQWREAGFVIHMKGEARNHALYKRRFPFDWPERKFSFKYVVGRMPRAERVEEGDKEADWMS